LDLDLDKFNTKDDLSLENLASMKEFEDSFRIS
jgi:hypothetical protein